MVKNGQKTICEDKPQQSFNIVVTVVDFTKFSKYAVWVSNYFCPYSNTKFCTSYFR